MTGDINLKLAKAAEIASSEMLHSALGFTTSCAEPSNLTIEDYEEMMRAMRESIAAIEKRRNSIMVAECESEDEALATMFKIIPDDADLSGISSRLAKWDDGELRCFVHCFEGMNGKWVIATGVYERVLFKPTPFDRSAFDSPITNTDN